MLVHLDGFDSYTSTLADFQTEYYVPNSNTTIATSGGRFGGGAMFFNSNSTPYIQRLLPSGLTELWAGYALNASSFGTNGAILFNVLGASGAEFSISYYNGSVKFIRGAYNGTLASTVSATISTGAWHWLEFRYKYHASTGVAEVWCDGVQIATYSGNTTSAGSGSVTTLEIGPSAGSNYSLTGYIDDLYILDATQGANTTRLGDSRIATLLPAGNAGPNNGTPSSGSNYACVNEAQWNTSNYVTLTNTTGQEELYTMGSLPTSPSSIFGVRVVAIAEKSDAGSAGLYPAVKSGGVEGDQTGIPVLTTWGRQSGIFETDPNTSGAWTASAVNAMACGVKVV